MNERREKTEVGDQFFYPNVFPTWILPPQKDISNCFASTSLKSCIGDICFNETAVILKLLLPSQWLQAENESVFHCWSIFKLSHHLRWHTLWAHVRLCFCHWQKNELSGLSLHSCTLILRPKMNLHVNGPWPCTWACLKACDYLIR